MRGSPFYLVSVMCLAEVLTMLGVFIFPALIPEFIVKWNLSNTDAGWIAGILLGGYALSVPVLVSLTDRIDARLIYIFSAILTAVALFGFAYFRHEQVVSKSAIICMVMLNLYSKCVRVCLKGKLCLDSFLPICGHLEIYTRQLAEVVHKNSSCFVSLP